MWLSTNKGLRVFYPESNRFANLEYSDGLQSNEFNTGSFLKLPSGNLLFGGLGGLNLINPTDFQEFPKTANPVLTGVFINHLPVPYSLNNFNLDWRNN